ncbi:MAG: AcrB/AcrD/AcrF family protein [Alphaproteobacteria bacterium]|nr:AcrB/AcrD/AcrF family protein [Alphaproteobacteria bacterium]
MFQPDGYAVALAMMLVTMVCWGSWANTMKLAPGFPFPLFYWDYVIGVLLVSLLLGLTMGSTGGPDAMLADLGGAGTGSVLYALAGGAVFNVANLLLVAAISIAGLAVAFPVGIGLALVVGVLLNYAIAPAGNPLLLFAGVALVLVAILVDALAYRARGQQGQHDVGRGLRIAIACGFLMGIFYPLVTKASEGPAGLGPYSVSFLFSVGVLLSALVFNTYLMRRPITADPPCSFAGYRIAAPGTHLVGIAGGAIWGVGMTFSLVAATTHFVGPAVSYAIGQGATMVSAAWGVFVWREFAGAPASTNKLLALMFVLFLAGLGLVAIAPLYP